MVEGNTKNRTGHQPVQTEEVAKSGAGGWYFFKELKYV